jgi:4-amino-4-deoxy-L-arabinose transferase-like glycosyltransferase
MFESQVPKMQDVPRRAEPSAPQQPEDQSAQTLFARVASVSKQRALVYCVLLAFALRLCLAWSVEQTITPDGVHYIELARSLMKGNLRNGLSTYWSPLYPLLVGLSSLLFRDIEFAGRFVSVVAGTLLVIVSHRLFRNWYGKRIALVGAFLVALHPLLIYYSTAVLTEATYTLFFTWGVLAGWSAIKDEAKRTNLGAGAVFGVCYLLKPEAVGFLLLLLVMIVFKKLLMGAGSWQASARNALLLCAGFLLVSAPYLFYLRHQTGAWTLSRKTSAHLWQGSRAAGGDFDPIRVSVPNASTTIVLVTKAFRFEYEILNLIFPPAFVLLVGLGLFRTSWTAERSLKELYLLSFVAATLAGYAITLPNIRFLMPLLPLLLCWLAKGVTDFAEWVVETLANFKSARRFTPYVKNSIVPITASVLLVSVLPLFIYLLRGDKWNDYYGQKRAAQWIEQHDKGRAPVIMATVPITAFYAKGRNVLLIDEDYTSLMSHARREQVDYLVVNERDFRYMNLRTLLDTQSAHPGLRLAFDFVESPGHKLLLYAVDRDASGSL